MAVQLNPQQKAVIENQGGELLVAAAAGSGKTFVLVERLLDRIKNTGNLSDFVVITYTNEAAKELKQRIGQELNKQLALDLQNAHIRKQVAMLPQAKICTIHSLCTRLLREQGHEIGINPSFRVCAEGEAKILRGMVADRTIAQWYDKEERGNYHAMVNSLAQGNKDDRLQKILLDMYGKIQSHENPEGWVAGQKEKWENLDHLPLEKMDWGQILLERYEKQLAQAVIELKECKRYCKNVGGALESNYCPSDPCIQSVEQIKTLVGQVLAGNKTWDDLVILIRATSFPGAGRSKGTIDEREKKIAQGFRDSAKSRLQSFYYEKTVEEKKTLQALREDTKVLMDLVMDFSQQYQLEKERRNLLDYGDLEHFTVKLLCTDQGQATVYAEKISAGMTEMMVDEYQDTNRVQNAIFNALTQDGKKLFMVGDMRQAIYRFRLADPSIFNGKFQKNVAQDPSTAPEGVPRVLTLDNNFRSREEVLASCNDLFSDMMTPAFGEVDYQKDGMLQRGGSFYTDPSITPGYYNTELQLLDMTQHDNNSKNETVPKELAEARWVAKKIKTMVEEKFLISNKAGDGSQPVGYGDFMVLLRSKKKLVPYYLLAMEAEEIPVVTGEGDDIFESMEVNVAKSLLQIVDNPLQDVPLLSVLRSPLFGFLPDELALLKKYGKFGRFYEVMSRAKLSDAVLAEEQACFALALEKRDKFVLFLEKARQDARELSPAELLWQLYEQCNAMGIFSAMSEGSLRQEHLLEFYQVVLHLEGQLSACLTQLEKLQALGEVASFGKKQREGDAVVIHSIHKSKGLEKPVVFLAGLFRSFNLRDLTEPVLFHQDYGMGLMAFESESNSRTTTLPYDAIQGKTREETLSEELRVLYVAMTRAREKLFLSLVGNMGDEVSVAESELIKPLQSTYLLDKRSFGQMVLPYFLSREKEGKALSQFFRAGSLGIYLPDPKLAASAKSQWNWAVVDYEAEVANVGVATPSTASQTSVNFGNLQVECQENFQWKYPYLLDTVTPSKITATQTKGRKILQEESGEEEFQLVTDREVEMLDKMPAEMLEELSELADMLENSGDLPLHGEKAETKPAEKKPKRKFEMPRKPDFAVEQKKGRGAKNTMTAAERGTAMHAFMEFLQISPDLDYSDTALQALKEQLLAEGKLSPRQYEVVSVEKTLHFLNSVWGQEAIHSACCRHEFKFSMLMPGQELGTDTEATLLLQGVVDLFYEKSLTEVVIVDFKSDKIRKSDLKKKAVEHGNQLTVYGKALEEILGKKVVSKVLWFSEIDAGVAVD